MAAAGQKAMSAEGGVLGRRCSGCGRSAGVSSRTHLRWPTPVRPSPDSRVKGKDFQMFFLGGGGRKRREPSMPTGKCFLNARGGRCANGMLAQRRALKCQKDGGSASAHPKMLRDGPARVRPANYGGSGEIISPDVFPVFPVFLSSCLFCLSAFSVFTQGRAGYGYRGRG